MDGYQSRASTRTKSVSPVGVIDANGVEIAHASFDSRAGGFAEAIDMLGAHRVGLVGVESSASWGADIAIAVVAAGFTHAKFRRNAPRTRAASVV